MSENLIREQLEDKKADIESVLRSLNDLKETEERVLKLAKDLLGDAPNGSEPPTARRYRHKKAKAVHHGKAARLHPDRGPWAKYNRLFVSCGKKQRKALEVYRRDKGLYAAMRLAQKMVDEAEGNGQ